MFIEGPIVYDEGANTTLHDLVGRSIRGLLMSAHQRNGIGLKDVMWVGPFNDLFQAPRVCANIVYPQRCQTLAINNYD